MMKIERNVIEIDYICEVCGRCSGSESIIKRCEALHEDPACQKEWWKDKVSSLYFYETAAELLKESNNEVSIEENQVFGVGLYDIFVRDPAINSIFYLDYCDTKEEAINICKTLGWRIINC